MNFIKHVFLLFVILLLSNCASYQDSVYLRNDEILDTVKQKYSLFEYRIMPKDELTITVSTTTPEASAPFYRKIGMTKGQNGIGQGMDNAKLLDYLVDNEGYIDFPVLGMISVAGLSTRECEAVISEKLQAYLNEVPNVTVRSSSYKVSVLGEVARPGTYRVDDEKITIFQALAEAGDMTLFSDRKDVHLLREDGQGRRKVIHLDLTEANIALSPYYYLQQNDVVYVKPTPAKVSSNTFTGNASAWITMLSLVTTVVSLIMVITN